MTLWVFHIYVATFQQHLQMEYMSFSWGDVRFHQDHLHEFCNPLSCLCYKWTLICLVCTDCRSFVFAWLVTMCDIWPVVGVSRVMNATCGTWHYLPSWAFVSNSTFNGAPVAQTLVSNVNHCLPFVFSLSLSLWSLSFGILVLVTQMLSSDFPYAYWVSNCHCL